METPSYIKALLLPTTRKPAGRKVWSIDLECVWLPFFTATNTVGDTSLPLDALGSPLRLGYNNDGSVKFSKTGKPIIKVVKPLAESIRMVRDNFTAGLLGYTEKVVTENEAGYKKQVTMARKAGEPIMARDRANLDKAVAIALAEAVAKAEAVAEAEARVKAEAEAREAQPPDKAKVPVTA